MTMMFPFRPALWNKIPAIDWDLAYTPMTSRWLYIFGRPEGQDASVWLREVWVDEEGWMCPTLEGDALTPNPVSSRPPAGPRSAANLLVLPGALPQRGATSWYRTWYRFFASRVRLSQRVVEGLRAGHKGEFSHDEVFFDASYFTNPPPWYFRPADGSSQGQFLIRVVDPLHVAASLQATYSAALFSWIRWDVPLPPAPDFMAPEDRHEVETQRTEALTRQKNYLLMQLLEDVLARDPDDSAGLRGCLHLGEFERELARVRSVRSTLEAARERGGEDIGIWDRSEFMRLCLQAHEDTGDPLDVADFLTTVAAGFLSLSASAAGLSYLRLAVADPAHFISRYVLPERPLDGQALQAVRKSIAAVITLYDEATPAVIANLGTSPVGSAFARLLTLNQAVGERVFELVAREVTLPSALGRVVSQGQVVTSRQLVPDESVLEMILGLPGVARQAPLTLALVYERTMRGVERANLVLAVVDHVRDPRVESFAGVVGAGLDFATTLQNPIVTRLTRDLSRELAEQSAEHWKRAFRLVGGASAAIDAALALGAMRDARSIGDDSVFAGNGLIFVGSVCGVVGAAWGAYLGVAAASSAVLGPLAIAGVLLIAGGTLVVAFTSDTDWQTFLQHCKWGKPGPLSSGTSTPNWSPLQLRELKGDLDAQLASVMNLFVSYSLSVEAAGVSLTIAPGLIGEGATFHLVLQGQWFTAAPYGSSGGQWASYELELTWGAPLRAVSGGAADDFTATYMDLEGAAPRVVITGPPTRVYRDTNGRPVSGSYLDRRTWYVRLDLRGDGSQQVPRRGWVPVGTFESTSFASGRLVSAAPPLPTA